MATLKNSPKLIWDAFYERSLVGKDFLLQEWFRYPIVILIVSCHGIVRILRNISAAFTDTRLKTFKKMLASINNPA